MAQPTHVYCSRTDIDNVLSEKGVDLRADDSPPTELGDVLDEAASIIDQKCTQRYTVQSLQDSRIIRHWSKWIAAFLLCKRRNNDASNALGEEYDRVMKELDGIAAGKFTLGDAVARRPSLPGMSNPRVIMNPWPHVVVEKRTSTGLPPQDYRQKKDPLGDMDGILDYSV